MRKVMMVVPVLIISCQASEKPNAGPTSAQTRITAQAARNAQPVPSAMENRAR